MNLISAKLSLAFVSAALSLAVSGAGVADVPVSPFLMPEAGVAVGAEPVPMGVNIPLFRRVVLKPSDVQSVSIHLALQ